MTILMCQASVSSIARMLKTDKAQAHAIVDDVQGGFSYLPERDVKVLKDWMHRPCGF